MTTTKCGSAGHLTATPPNHVWTWDVTDFTGPTTGEHDKLSVVLDLYRRYVVAWMLARRESAALAQRLIATAYRRHGIVPGQLTTHRDRGRMHIAKDLHALYEDLGNVRSLSRPRVSNDHPHVESLFKTTTYIAGYPDRFTDFAHAEQWCAVLAQRHRTMTRAFALTPARGVRGALRTATCQQPSRFIPSPSTTPPSIHRTLAVQSSHNH